MEFGDPIPVEIAESTAVMTHSKLKIFKNSNVFSPFQVMHPSCTSQDSFWQLHLDQ
jgi:hypothetical protein